jgi:quercetin dioxygenase-like cupin family protein
MCSGDSTSGIASQILAQQRRLQQGVRHPAPPSEGLTVGVARLLHGGSLHTHRHAQHEAYYVLDGVGLVTIEGTARTVSPGVVVFIPGNALHSVDATWLRPASR